MAFIVLRREAARRRAVWRPPLQFWTIWLMAACVIVFVLQLAFGITDLISLVPAAIAWQPWGFVTSIFAHGSFGHLFNNMWSLGLFGFILERLIGGGRYLALFSSAGILASVASFFAYPQAISLGASGAIMGVVGTLVVLRPRLMVWFMGPMPLFVVAALWALIDLVGFFSARATGIGNAAHLAGLAIGIIYGLRLRKEFGEQRRRYGINHWVSEERFRDWEDEHLR